MEPLSPVAIEQKLRTLLNDLTTADLALARARDEEVGKKHAYESARRESRFHKDCPKVERGGYTVAYVEDWIAERVANVEEDYDLAVARREAAQDHLRTLRTQVDIVRTLGASVRQAYEMAGTS